MNKIGDLGKTSDLVNELIVDKSKEASQIPLTKPVIVVPDKVDITESSNEFWRQRSQELLSKYRYGTGLGKFGNNSKDTSMMFARLIEAIIETIKFECNSNTINTDGLTLYFESISSTMMLLSRELERMEVESINHHNLLATFHGFIESYLIEVLSNK